jgi:hypothetical protein
MVGKALGATLKGGLKAGLSSLKTGLAAKGGVLAKSVSAALTGGLKAGLKVGMAGVKAGLGIGKGLAIKASLAKVRQKKQQRKTF